jgi:hypothetical protein
LDPLVEDSVLDGYKRSLFADAGRFVIIYSSNKVEALGVPCIRHRLFTKWIEQHAPQWLQLGYVGNRYPYDPKRVDDTSFGDFYFFYAEALSQTLHRWR